MMKRTPPEADDFAALIGLDWGSQAHALCLYDCATGARESSTLEHTPEAIAHWAASAGQALPPWEDRPLSGASQRPPHLRAHGLSLPRALPGQPSDRAATARPLRPAGPRAIPPMRRSASSYSSTTATSSLPGTRTILRRAGLECEQYRPAPVLAGVEYQASLFRCTRGIHQCADVSYGEDVLCCFVVIGQCLDRGAWVRGDIPLTLRGVESAADDLNVEIHGRRSKSLGCPHLSESEDVSRRDRGHVELRTTGEESDKLVDNLLITLSGFAQL